MDAFSSYSIVFLLTIFQLSYAHDDDIHFTSCAPFDCGNLPNISYPFWTDQHNRPSYCGYGNEGYKLKCLQNHPPVMILGSQDFQVLHLNQSRDLLTIKRVELNSTCPHQILITNLFNYSETAENIILHSGGRCGSNESLPSALLCYCRDRPHRLKCQHAHVPNI
ncbi:LEAF RUST 10 DISEASE-RESISTANCE LOCUS RECEPTOR-LIKE PROTEIN KINASE-like 2.1 [Gossypium australe]|uniref:LEAF RUST 10 DISEASE-RESISTANCE LOCUS RECEPTOR-LIKE PROTEIN KINASE-like 2.1 n=1 Tax=Gossypium australe TaxID=47621 RepID=A0A5B6UG52_9ROSI|nr:LEAF RUST 10 DISEASE-RESISTANCE LOCUS RECEPTOR-LIKE PROTEIN KINASE-like 2.1 [Gossypium australe]